MLTKQFEQFEKALVEYDRVMNVYMMCVVADALDRDGAKEKMDAALEDLSVARDGLVKSVASATVFSSSPKSL